MNPKLLGIGATFVLCAATFATPVGAQHSLNEQPAVGPIKQAELRLEHRIKADYRLGLLGPLEFAMLSRDLDGIRVQEEEKRLNGIFTDHDFDSVMKKLVMFEDQVIGHETDKAASVAVVRTITPR